MLIDTHAHINLHAFKDDAEAVLRRAFESGVGVINVGTEIETSREAVRMLDSQVDSQFMQERSTVVPAEPSSGLWPPSPKGGREESQADGIWAAVGLHPSHTYDNPYLDENESAYTIEKEIFDYEAYKKLALHPRVVGIGECGLDYYRIENKEYRVKNEEAEVSPVIPATAGIQSNEFVDSGLPAQSLVETGMTKLNIIKLQQREAFEGQIRLAQELDKALIVHCRPSQGSTDAYDDLFSLLLRIKDKGLRMPRFEIHSFTGPWEVAEKFLDIGGYLGFNGIITFDKSGVLAEVVRNAPLDRILLETDSPYLAPVPHRGKRNEPSFVIEVTKKVAEIKNISLEEVARQTTYNARKLFKLNI